MFPAERRRLSMCDIPNPELAVGVVIAGDGCTVEVTMAGLLRR